MSQSYREGNNDAKAARRGIDEKHERIARRKPAAGSVVVECRYIETHEFTGQFGRGVDWFKWRKWAVYRSTEIAQSAMANLSRKYKFYEYRIAVAGDGP